MVWLLWRREKIPVAEINVIYNKEFDCSNYSFSLLIIVVGWLSSEGERKNSALPTMCKLV
jgi:hypothetical protein